MELIDLLWKADVRMSQGPHSSGQHASLPGQLCVEAAKERKSATFCSIA